MTMRTAVFLVCILIAGRLGLADSITVGDQTYREVYIVETSLTWIVSFPSDGTTRSFDKSTVNKKDVHFSDDIDVREALYLKWRLSSEARKAAQRNTDPQPIAEGENQSPNEHAQIGSNQPNLAPMKIDQNIGITTETLLPHTEQATIPTISDVPIEQVPNSEANARYPSSVSVESAPPGADGLLESIETDAGPTEWLRFTILVVLALAAGGMGGLIVQTVVGLLVATGIHLMFETSWIWSLQAGLAGGYALMACPILVASLKSGSGLVLIMIAALAFGLPASFVSHYVFNSGWARAATEGAFLAILTPIAILRTLIVFGVIKRPEHKTSMDSSLRVVSTSNLDAYSSGAPMSPPRSEARLPPAPINYRDFR